MIDDPTKPPVSVLAKLGSIVMHVDEMLSAAGHPFDRIAAEQLLNDGEVREWLRGMDSLQLLPKAR